MIIRLVEFVLGLIAGVLMLLLAWSSAIFTLVAIVMMVCLLISGDEELGGAVWNAGLVLAICGCLCAPVLALAIYFIAWKRAWLAWSGIAAGAAVFPAVFTYLWIQGHRLDRAAKNPLRSILERETTAARQSTRPSRFPRRLVTAMLRLTGSR